MPGARGLTRLLAALGSLAIASTVASDAAASGISLGKFGGIYGHANAEGGLGLYWNPARLSIKPGLWGTIDASPVHRRAAYTREIDTTNASRDEILVNSGRASVNTYAVLPYLALGYTHDFDSVNLGLALGAFPTFGGSAKWDRNNEAPPEFPGAVDGPQRWATIASILTVIHYTAALAVTFEDIGLSLGATGAYVDTTLDTIKARNLNTTDSLVDSRGVIQEGRAHFMGDAQKLVFTFGIAYEDKNVKAGINVRPKFDLKLIGPIRQAYATNPPTTEEGQVDFPLPSIVNYAVTPRFGKFELTLAGEIATWSRIKTHDVFATDTGTQILEIPRGLEDTITARLVPGWHFTDRWLGSMLIGGESSSVPEATVEAGFLDAPKVFFGFGGRYERKKWSIAASWHRERFLQVDVDNSIVRPTANGRYNDQRDFFNVTLEGRL